MNLPKIKTEAVEVYNQTGLTPKQLLEQRDELLEALNQAMKCLESCAVRISGVRYEDVPESVVESTCQGAEAIIYARIAKMAIAKARVE